MVAGGLSKSCLKVLDVLASSKNKGINQKEIIDGTNLSTRTVKYALQFLKLRNLVSEIFLMNDLRCKTYIYGGKLK